MKTINCVLWSTSCFLMSFRSWCTEINFQSEVIVPTRQQVSPTAKCAPYATSDLEHKTTPCSNHAAFCKCSAGILNQHFEQLTPLECNQTYANHRMFSKWILLFVAKISYFCVNACFKLVLMFARRNSRLQVATSAAAVLVPMTLLTCNFIINLYLTFGVEGPTASMLFTSILLLRLSLCKATK